MHERYLRFIEYASAAGDTERAEQAQRELDDYLAGEGGTEDECCYECAG